jgi:hypothetical protein
MTHHRKAQVAVTVSILIATAAHFVCSVCAPQYQHVAPIAGLASSLLWIWIE